ncbi:MAG TPA: DegT/DnrJ/EryC1/StrS family aminotransferase, partial [Saprospiraceae bacterium]|nr:DegT/DnrJ/EryC1/StrS family aminotransferase [Saprospiraceae bacterium]
QSSAYAAGVNSGLDALILSLKALGIGAGDEVIVPANTYIATWNAIQLAGAVPVPVEPDVTTMNIHIDNILPAIKKRTKAILPVHLYGLPCQMRHIMNVADAHDLYVIEDNAQAVGASVNGKKTGTWGYINATSFYPTKNLGALGDGGMVTSDDADLISRVKSLRNYGSAKRYVSKEIGLNSRLDELQAAMLRIKLRKLDLWLAERKQVAKQYLEGLKDVSEITLPVDDPNHTYHLFVIRCDDRDALAAHLDKQGISTLVHYPIPPHLQEAYRFLKYSPGSFPITESIANTCLSLPLYYGFQRANEVVEAIRGYYK